MDREEMRRRASVMMDKELRAEWDRCQAETRPRTLTADGPDPEQARHATEKLGILKVEANSRGIDLSGAG